MSTPKKKKIVPGGFAPTRPKFSGAFRTDEVRDAAQKFFNSRATRMPLVHSGLTTLGKTKP